MAHECEQCGQQCYCDMDDCGGFPQPNNCVHLVIPGRCECDEYDDDACDDPASPGPNNAEKEGAGWGEDEGEREP